jgi:ankyrin repeat protein
LSECAARGHSELAEFLIQKGADVNMRSKSVFLTGTPLEIATQRKRDSMISLLKKYGAQ